MNDRNIEIIHDRAHPFLHEMFKAEILYNYGRTFQTFINKNPKSKLQEWNILESRQEIIISNGVKRYIPNGYKQKIGDVMWILERKDNHGKSLTKRIIHEIKTGDCDILSIFSEYKGLMSNIKNDSNNRVAGEDYLWIWGWSNKIKNLPNKEPLKKIFDGNECDYPERSLWKRMKGGRVRVMLLDSIKTNVESEMTQLFNLK